MGTPSTVSTVGNQTWYYISQTTTQRVKFLEPTVVEQRVLAINFNKNMKVERIANYGLQDGVVFDFISRTTPTGGTELSLVRQTDPRRGPRQLAPKAADRSAAPSIVDSKKPAARAAGFSFKCR